MSRLINQLVENNELSNTSSQNFEGSIIRTYLSFWEKIEILTVYKNDVNGGNGTIANIAATEKYIYNGKEYPIGTWVRNLRSARKGINTMKISDKQVQALDKLGMAWEVYKYIPFATKLEILTAYANDVNAGNGTIANIKVEEEYTYNGQVYPVRQWIEIFRRAYNGKGGNKLTSNQRQALENLGIVWCPNASNFETKLEVLTAYTKDKQKSNGTIANILQREKYVYEGIEYPIGSWLDVFRQTKKGNNKCELTTTQIQQLEALGMVWDANNKISFATKVEVLSAYIQDETVSGGTIANIDIRQKYIYKDKEYPIGLWINSFRRAHKGVGTCKINQTQIKQLEDLGMVWKGKNTKCGFCK